MTKVINLTQHTINIYDNDENEIFALPPSGSVARIRTEEVPLGRVLMEDETSKVGNRSFIEGAFPLFMTETLGDPYVIREGKEEPLPKEIYGTIFVVSGIFRSHFKRSDFWQPGRLLRNEKGQPIGCVGLSR